MSRFRSRSFSLASGSLIVLLSAVGAVSAAVTTWAAPAQQAAGLPEPVQLSATFSRIAKRVEPAVVSITAEVQRPPASNRRRGGNNNPPDPFGFGEESPQNQAPRGSAEGSGFIVDRSGYI